MARQATPSYRPPRWILVAGVASAFVFAAVTAIAFATGMRAYGVGLSIGTLFATFGVFDLLRSRLVLRDEGVEVRSLMKHRLIPYAEMAEVRIDGGRTCVRLRSGAWVKLPEWLGANMSVRHRIAHVLRSTESH